MAVSLGLEAHYVGVVGVWKTGKAAQPFDFKYQLVELGEEFMTPAKERGLTTRLSASWRSTPRS